MPDQMTPEEADELLAQMMPEYAPEVRLSIITLMGELVKSNTPNGTVYSIGNGDKMIEVEVRYAYGKSAAAIIVELREERDRLLHQLESVGK